MSKGGIPTPQNLREAYVGNNQPYFDKAVQSFKEALGKGPHMRFDGIGPDRMGPVFRVYFEFPEHGCILDDAWKPMVVAYLHQQFPSYAFSIHDVISAYCNADEVVDDKDFARDLQQLLDGLASK